MCNTKFLKWCCSNFNGTSRIFSIDPIRSFVITEDDVFDALGIPLGEIFVDFNDRNLTDGAAEILKTFQCKYELGSKCSMKDLTEVLMNFKGDIDDFKRLFVIFVINTFFFPPSNQIVKMGIVNHLLDVSKIPKLNWCGFVLNSLCFASKSFRKKSSFFSGCCLLLVVLYFHRVTWHGVEAPSTTPLIRHWSQEEVTERSKLEVEAGFGGGILITGVYPVTKKGKEKITSKKVGEGGEGNGEFFLKFSLSEADQKDSEIKMIAKDAVHEIILQLKRDLSVVTSHRMTLILELVKNSDNSSKEPSDTQKFFEQDCVLQMIDEIVDQMKRKVRSDMDDMPSFDLLTPTPPAKSDVNRNEKPAKKIDHVLLEPAFCSDADDDAEYAADIGSDNAKAFSTPVHNYRASKEELSEALISAGRSIISTCKVSSKVDQFWAIDREAGYVSRFCKRFKDVLAPLDQCERELIDYCFSLELFNKDQFELLFRGLPIWGISRDEMISLFPNTRVYCSVISAWSFIVNKDQFSGRSRFVFNLEYSGILADYTKIWEVKMKKKRTRRCGKLNGKGGEKLDGKGGEKLDEDKMYEDSLDKLRNSIFKTFDIFINLIKKDFTKYDMLFLPIHLYNHYTLLVVNLVEKKFHYLDNLYHEDDNNVFVAAAKFLAEAFKIYVRQMNHPRFRDIESFELDVVTLPIHLHTSSNLDCAVFVMHYIVNFNGTVSRSPDLTKVAVRRILRAQFFCTIMLHDLNVIRDEVLKKVLEFYREKTRNAA